MFVIALQFFSQDRDKAARLARLICNLEPKHRNDVEILLVRRFDCEQLDRPLIDAIASKFYVSGYKTKTEWTGWPAGPNATAKDTLAYLCSLWQEIDGVLMLEPDSVPLAGWLDKIIAEWRIAKANGKALMGAWRDSGPTGGHINGNLVFNLDYYERSDIYNVGKDYAWDCYVSERLSARWHKTDLIANCFDSVNATEEVFAQHPNAVLIHGFKDTSMLELAEGRLK